MNKTVLLLLIASLSSCRSAYYLPDRATHNNSSKYNGCNYEKKSYTRQRFNGFL